MAKVGNKKVTKVGNKKVTNNPITPPTISIATENLDYLTSIQKSIIEYLKLKGNKFTLRGCATHLHCDHKNITYHLNKLKSIGLVEKDGEFGLWTLSLGGEQMFTVGNKTVTKNPVGNKTVTKNSNLYQCNGEEITKKHEQRVLRKVLSKGIKITKIENETIRLFFQEFMTPQEIADFRGVKKKAVEKTIRILKNKGVWGGEQKRLPNQGGCKGALRGNNKFRLHAEQFYIKILDTTDSYNKLISKVGKGIEYIEGNTVLYNEKSIQIIGKKDFEGEFPMETQNKSMEYWTEFILKLEQKFKILLIKPNYQNIRYTKSGEYADTENDIAKSYNNRKQKLMIRGSDDNKVWLHIDKSWNKDEFEYSHSKRSLDDAIQIDETFEDIENNFTGIEDTFNDIRDKFDITEPFKPSEVFSMLGVLTQKVNFFQNQTAKLQNQVQELGASQKVSIEMFNNLIKVMSPKVRPQSSSGDDDKFNPGNSSMFM